jgi:hypothetical protein
MRTTITLNSETHSFASYYAHVRGLTLSAAIEELITKAQAPPPEIQYSPNGLPMFVPSKGVVTAAMVSDLEEEAFDPKPFA